MKNFPTKEELRQGAVMLIDKPYRWTSFDALNKVRRLFNAKIGHCGTLDPLATGLLICCTGKMTKQIETFQKQEKEYTGIIQLGATTPTYDLESEPADFKSCEGLTAEVIRAATAQFIGEILQEPPAHSAIKKDGKRAYELARKGIEMKLAPRPVTIRKFELAKIDGPAIHFRISCSTGTYIRSLAHDFGAALGCGGYLKALRRTKIGAFSVDDAPDVEEWVAKLKEPAGQPAT
jgi:tRNA pseudouridine55 synthase